MLSRWQLLRRALRAVTSKSVADTLADDPDKLHPGGEERIVTALFADVQAAKAAGFDAHVTKPADAHALDEVLSHRSQRKAS